MNSGEKVMKWIKDTFDDLGNVIIEDYERLPFGKKIMDFTDDYVIVYYDDERDRVKYRFKER